MRSDILLEVTDKDRQYFADNHPELTLKAKYLVKQSCCDASDFGQIKYKAINARGAVLMLDVRVE